MTESQDTPWPPQTRALRIGPLVIELLHRRLRHPEGETELPPRIFELLLLFVAEPHVMHTRQDLLRRGWSGLIVEDGNLSQSVSTLRKALGEERKDWIRTLPKKGYVFEPPLPIEAITAEAITAIPGEAEPHVATARMSPASIRRPSIHRSSFRWLGYAAAAALLVAGLAAHGLRSPAATQRTATTVTLIEADDPGAAATARMPATLLHAWLEWKLGALPEVQLLAQTELAADRPASNVVVLLASGPLPQDPTRIFVQARFDTADGAQRIQRVGAPQHVASLVDAVSRDVIRILLPARAHEPWPTLQVDAATAQRYAALRRARQTRQWTEAAAIGKDMVARTPNFALGRLHLAQTLATLGQLPPAQEHIAAARTLLQPLSPDVAAVLDAQQLELSPRYADTAAAYAALAARYPNQPMFAVQHARALGRMGRFADARTVLSSKRWDRPQPVAIRLAQLTNRASMESALGDQAAARASAMSAAQLAAAAGEGWAYERGQALLALAHADAYADGGVHGSPYYAQAATQFEQAGDTFAALRARFNGEIAAPSKGPLVHLDAWLAQTRAAGQRQMELGALRGAAFHYLNAGDMARFRERLLQAEVVAGEMRDAWSMDSLAVSLLTHDFLRGDHVAVERRIARMSRSGLQGTLALWVRQFESLVATDRGRYREALAALDQGERLARSGRNADEPPSPAAAIFACSRASILLSQGKAVPARTQYDRCAAGGDTHTMMARVGLTELELMSGDRTAALRHLRFVHAHLPEVTAAPDRWSFTVDAAALFLRAGDPATASKLLEEVLPHLQAARLHRPEAFAYVALAEVALVRNDADAAREHADAARALFSHGLWMPRLTQLDIAIAHANGEHATAELKLHALDREAHQRGDALAQLLAHSWIAADDRDAACSAAERTALVARTGFHAARLDWLQPDRSRLTALR